MPMNFQDAPPNTSGPPGGEEMDLVSTHLRLLVAAAVRTKGDILELGCGWYSTPVLHEIARAQDRRLWTFDNQEYWLPPFKPFAKKWPGHKVIEVGSWDEMYSHFEVQQRFGLVFVDQGQPIEREYAVRRLLAMKAGDVFVMHDTEEHRAYGYGRSLPLFKWQFTDKSQKAWTTVASNTTDVTKWGFIALDPHEPSKEIT
jgi:predicted O-methyltransferase YrrM